ncbi:MAG TPA: hypothetical protein ENN99_04550 [Chloroflexi bacterium]|nr:hypothetical protein [Chloroflexota bacterium]
MNTLNRIVMVILLLVAIVLCTLALVIPVSVLEVVETQAGTMADNLDRQPWYVLLPVGVLIALVLDVGLAFLIFLELRRPSRRSIRVEKTDGGEVMITVDSIADRLRYEVDRLPSVLRARPQVSGKRGGVIVEMDVETATGVQVPETSAQVLNLAHRVVEEDMGLKLAHPPKINLRVMPYPKTAASPVKSRTVTRVEPEPAPAAPFADLPDEPVPTEVADDSPDLEY